MFETLESVKERLKLGPTQGQCHDHKNEAKAAAEAPQPRGSVTVHCFEPSANNFRCGGCRCAQPGGGHCLRPAAVQLLCLPLASGGQITS